MKKTLIVVGIVLVVVLAIVAILPGMLDVNHYHDRIQAELQKQLGRQVQLGQMNLKLLPPTFKVQNAVIGEDPKYNSGKPFALAQELDVEVKLMPLLHKEVQVTSLHMVHPQLELIRGVDGSWNFSSIGRQEHPKKEKPEEEKHAIKLDRFVIDDGAVAITDQQKHQPRMEYNHIDMVLKNFAPDKPFDVTVSAHLPGAGKELAKLDWHGGPINDATMVSTPFEGTLELDQVGLSGAQQYLNSKALAGTDASISGNLKFKNEAGKVSTTGTVRMENVVAHGKKLGFPIELDYNATNDLKTELLQVSNTLVKIGSAPFVINGTVNESTVPAVANLNVTTQNASLTELVKLGEALGMTLSPGMEPSGRLSANLTARGPLSGPAVAGTLSTSQLKVKGVEANSVLITLNMVPPGEDVVKTLTGRITVKMDNGKLTGVDMAQKLGEIGKFTGTTKVADGATHVSQLTGTFDLKNGVANTNDLKAVTDAGTIGASGAASLVDQGLNMRATAVLSKQSSQQVGGNSIGGLMTTAMANRNGEIVVPVLVTGTIPSPKVTPDLTAMAEMRMNNLLPSFSNPSQFTEGLLGKGGAGGILGLGGNKQPEAAASPQQKGSNAASEAVSGISGLFGKKKK